jgi:hypothetical protein
MRQAGKTQLAAFIRPVPFDCYRKRAPFMFRPLFPPLSGLPPFPRACFDDAESESGQNLFRLSRRKMSPHTPGCPSIGRKKWREAACGEYEIFLIFDAIANIITVRAQRPDKLWATGMEKMQNRLTVHEIAAKWDLSIRQVQKLCSQDMIPGVVRFGNAWAIPADAEKPTRTAKVKPGPRKKAESI